MPQAETTNSELATAGQSPENRPQKKSILRKFWQSPLLWAVLAYALFYTSLPMLPELLTRYCTSHPLEYVTMGLFFLGMATLLVRWVHLSAEADAVMQIRQAIGSISKNGQADANGVLQQLKSYWETTGLAIRETIAGRRLQSGIEYVSERSSGDKLEEHLRHCSDSEHDNAMRKLGFVNTISWAVPILGFLGTVMGITLAIANVTPDQLDQSLPEVTGGLAVAFDTTALSLTLSLGLVFTTYWIRSCQDEILNRVDQQLDRRLCFLMQTNRENNVLNLHATASAQLTEATEKIVLQVNDLWKSQLSGMQQRLLQTMDVEHNHFTETLHSGISRTLELQQEHLVELRTEEQRLGLELGEKLDTAMENWTQSLNTTGAVISNQTEELHEHTTQIMNLVDKQNQLAELQQKLHASLDASDISSTLDQTLNSLNAAIQLLNVRVSQQTRAA